MRLFAHERTCVIYFEGTGGYLKNRAELPPEREIEIGILTAMDNNIQLHVFGNNGNTLSYKNTSLKYFAM
jgi:hypothetical protein